MHDHSRSNLEHFCPKTYDLGRRCLYFCMAYIAIAYIRVDCGFSSKIYPNVSHQ